MRILSILALLATLVFATCALVAAPADVADVESDTDAATLDPLESVELTNDAAESNAETVDEEVQEERGWGDWRVRIGAVFLGRPDPPAWRFNNGFYYGDRRINAADLDFPIGPASDISLRLPGSVVDLDFRYFGVSQATADTGPLPGVHYETHYENRASLMSSLQSAELNLRREVYPSVALLAGFRYGQFREQWATRQELTSGLGAGLQFGNDTIARNELVRVANRQRSAAI